MANFYCNKKIFFFFFYIFTFDLNSFLFTPFFSPATFIIIQCSVTYQQKIHHQSLLIISFWF